MVLEENDEKNGLQTKSSALRRPFTGNRWVSLVDD